MKKKIDSYSFKKISSNMATEFGAIEKYLEGRYTEILFPLESNLLRANRKHGIDNGRRVIEAIHICLFIVDGYLKQIEYDVDPYISDDNKPYLRSLLMSFDPFTNEYIKPIAEERCDIHSDEGLHAYFEAPIKCLLRIEKSIELWTEKLGINGYFSYLEDRIGEAVANDDQIDCIVVKIKDANMDELPKMTIQEIFSGMSPNDIFSDFFPAIASIFKLGFIPVPDEFYEFTE